MDDQRALLGALFGAAVASADPARIVPAHLPARPAGRTLVIGAGKASAAMAAAFEAAWDGPLSGLVVTRYGHAVPCARVRIAEAAHPVPDAAGEAAAREMLGLVRGLAADDLVVALVSGGGSALLPLPAPGLALADKQAVNRALLASGATISEMNTVRRHLSAIKGGRLAAACHPARVESLLISDVPGDDPVIIASGPTVPDPSTLAEARAVVAKYRLDLPPAVARALADPANETVKPGDPRLARAAHRIVARPMAALEAAASVARRAGYLPLILGDAIEGEARAVGRAQAERALLEARAGRRVALLSGGETTVTLPADGRRLGEGGRNVDFLMALAHGLAGAPGIAALAADTDGVDGAAEVAGAILLPDTLARAEAAGYPLAEALHAFDGHGFFGRIGDAVVTGPTLTNVNDFRAILIG